MPAPLWRARMRCQASWSPRPASPVARKAATRKAKARAGTRGAGGVPTPASGDTTAAVRAASPMGPLPSRVPRWTVDGGNLSAHGPDVGAELATVMDRVEEDEPEELADRLLEHHLAAGEELTLSRPARIVERRHLAVQIVPVTLERPGRLLHARHRVHLVLAAAVRHEGAADAVLGDERGEEVGRGRRPLVRRVIEALCRHRADHAQEHVSFRLAPDLEELTVVHALSGFSSQGGHLRAIRDGRARPPLKPPSQRRRGFAAPPCSTCPLP